MKRTMLSMTLAALFALSLSACATNNSAAVRPESNPSLPMGRAAAETESAAGEKAPRVFSASGREVTVSSGRVAASN